ASATARDTSMPTIFPNTSWFRTISAPKSSTMNHQTRASKTRFRNGLEGGGKSVRRPKRAALAPTRQIRYSRRGATSDERHQSGRKGRVAPPDSGRTESPDARCAGGGVRLCLFAIGAETNLARGQVGFALYPAS